MKFHERTFAYKCGVFFCVLSIPSAILSLAFPTWKEDSIQLHGLFQICSELLNLSTCQSIDLYKYGVWFEVIRGFQILSILVMSIDIIFLCRRNPSRVEGFDVFFIGILYSVGPAMYTYYMIHTQFGQGASFSWGYILAWLSAGFTIIGSLCMCGSEYSPANRIEPYSEREDEKERKRRKKKNFSKRDWRGFPDHGSHMDKDYYKDYYKNRDPQWEYLHRY